MSAYPIALMAILLAWIGSLTLRRKDVNIQIVFLGLRFTFATSSAGVIALRRRDTDFHSKEKDDVGKVQTVREGQERTG